MPESPSAADSNAHAAADQAAESRGTHARAAPMTREQRRASIAAAAVPLYLEHGATLSTRTLAEHLGIAEGTIYRAFGDKASLLRAVVEAFFDSAREHREKGLVDPALPLEDKVAVLVAGMEQWMRNVLRMVSLIGREEAVRYFARGRDDDFTDAIAAVFAPNDDVLNFPADRLAAIMGVAGIAVGAAQRGPGRGLTADELARFVLYGIAGTPRRTD